MKRHFALALRVPYYQVLFNSNIFLPHACLTAHVLTRLPRALAARTQQQQQYYSGMVLDDLAHVPQIDHDLHHVVPNLP